MLHILWDMRVTQKRLWLSHFFTVVFLLILVPLLPHMSYFYQIHYLRTFFVSNSLLEALFYLYFFYTSVVFHLLFWMKMFKKSELFSLYYLWTNHHLLKVIPFCLVKVSTRVTPFLSVLFMTTLFLSFCQVAPSRASPSSPSFSGSFQFFTRRIACCMHRIDDIHCMHPRPLNLLSLKKSTSMQSLFGVFFLSILLIASFAFSLLKTSYYFKSLRGNHLSMR